MKYLVDTNVLSEVMRPRPNECVLDWFRSVDDERVFVSVISIAEIRRGIARLDNGKRRAALEQWLVGGLLGAYSERIFEVDLAVALRWGDMVARHKMRKPPANVMDTLLAATASVHECTLVTRNTKDFAELGISLHDPWSA